MADVVDLGAVKANAEKREQAEKEVAARLEREAAIESARTWDRQMRRVFKGIMPAKTRHRFLLERADA